MLSNCARRAEYDGWLDRSDGRVRQKGASRAAERNPFCREVHSPVALRQG